MARPRTALNTYGKVTTELVAPGKWRARTRYRFDDGKLRQVERHGATETKATNALKRALVDIQTPTTAAVKSETRISDLGERFLASKTKIAPRTLADYTRIVRNVINPRIGPLAVSEAGPDRLQRFLEDVSAERGPGAAKTTRAVLSGMMGVAARAEAVQGNPVRVLERMASSGDRAAVAIPIADLPGLLEKVRADDGLIVEDLVDLVVFLAGTGVRISEGCALAWPDVDLDAGVVEIRKSKTEAGKRRIRVSSTVVAMLLARRVRGGPTVDDLVFPTPLGRKRDPRAAARQWADARERLKLPERYTFHAFRKTVATLLDQAGLTARDIAEYLGHTNPALTQTVYMSKTVGGTRAADAVDSILTK